MRYFNCHTHTFNMQYMPEDFLRLQTSPHIAHALHWALNTKVISTITLWILKPFVGPKTIAFLKIGLKKTQDMVFADLCSNYPTQDDVKYIVLPIDFTYMGAGPLNIPYTQQLDDLFDLKLKYPNSCFPFVSIDPRSGPGEANRDFVKKYIEKGFSGIKLYPALGFFSFDEGLKEVFAYAEGKQIPIITHCSSGGINYAIDTASDTFVNPTPFHTLPGKDYHFPQGDLKMKDYCDQFNDPDNFREALDMFPNLKICFAHVGLNATDKYGNGSPKNVDRALKWFNTILELMKKYPNVYTDISYSVAYGGFCKWFREKYDSWPPEIQNRVLFGTDYFMTVQEDHGDDKEILDVAKKDLAEIFPRLAYDNIILFLKMN